MMSTASPLSVTIDSYSVQESVVYYPVTVSTNTSVPKSWTVLKRFSNFDELHIALSKSFCGVPPRPKKTFFKMKNSKDINQRRKELEVFANKLMACKELFNSSTLRAFFSIDTHAPEYSTRQALTETLIPQRILANPVSKLLLSPRANMVITVERLCSKDKEKQVSFLKSFIFASPLSSAPKAECELKWDIQLNLKVTCIAYCGTKGTFVFGTEAGTLYTQSLLKSGELEAAKNPTPAHAEAIADVCFEENEVYAVSVGADKRVVGTSLDGKILYSSKIGEHALSSVHSDSKAGTIIITNVNGELFICDIKSLKATLLQTLSLTDNLPILSSRLNLTHEVIVCLLPEEMRWYEYSAKSKGQELGRWKAASKVTCWEMYERKNVVVLDNEEGGAIFLNLTTGNVRYNMQAHTDSIKSIALDQSSGVIITSSKNLPLCVRPWPLS
eukprot:TRINITY_DN1308_c0_g1_i3.p1 TRINITY_DN1308_c0_g1~~TRINITY_DN1308_c0_g1_i3.p1  ORF type:complete len:443 (-),score=110.84 TRINITY_DN1308_c0_g1_i3:166-1494(-)